MKGTCPLKLFTHSLLTILLLATVAACSSPATSVAPTVAPKPAETSAPEPVELFLARPDGAKGIAIAYDMSSGREEFALPAGMASASGNLFFAAEPIKDADTKINSFDLLTGHELADYELDGRWTLSGLSPLGRWLALTRIPSESETQAWAKADEWKTEVKILDTKTGETKHILKLDGNFEVETVSADGTSLFLVQHLPALNPDHYVIRLYDLSQESLIADPLRAKGSDEVMAGHAWEGLASPNGTWLLTLYLSTRRNTAFIHTLNLVDKYPVCIDLPSGDGNFDQLKYYTLALNASKVYAANAALGVVAEINLSLLKVTNVVEFEPGAGMLIGSDSKIQTARNVLTKDGAKLYFTSGQNVWAYDTKTKTVSGPFLTEAFVSGLGVSSDGGRLFVAQKTGPLMTFDTTNVAASQ